MRKNSVKSTRINGEVQRALAEILRGGIKDPRISPLTSVVAVEVAPDLKTLKSAEGFIKNQLARIVNLRNTPDITFIMDQSIEYGVNMSRKIDEVISSEQAMKAERPSEAAECEEI